MSHSQFDFVFWGASGHAKVLAEIVKVRGGKVLALFDNNPKEISPLFGVPVLHGRKGYEDWLHSQNERGQIAAVSAIGGARGRDRCEYLSLFRSSGFATPFLIHHNASVAESSVIGDNSHILAMAVVGADAILGEATIVNTKASVDHECILGNGVHVAPGAILCGCIQVGAYTLIGAGAVVLPHLRIGSNVIVGAGSVVTRDLPDNVVAFGNPARIIRENMSV